MAKKKTYFDIKRADRAKEEARRQQRKRRIVIGSVSAVTVLVIAGLIVLLVLKLTEPHPIVGSADVFTDEKTGISYKAADPSFICWERGDLYAVETKTLKNEKTGETWEVENEYYTVKGAAPEKFLVADDGTVLYASGIVMPELGVDAIDRIRIATTSSVSAILQNITEPAMLLQVTEVYLDGQGYAYPATSVVSSYDLLFEFQEIPGIYYSVRYLSYSVDQTYADGNGETQNLGKNFLYNRYEARFVPVGDLLESYIGTAETGEAVTAG